MQQRGKLRALGAGVSLNMEFGIDLIHILLDASLGEVALLCDLAVAQALRNEFGQLTLPRGQRAVRFSAPSVRGRPPDGDALRLAPAPLRRVR